MPCASYRWIMALPRNSENPFGFWTRDLPTDCRFAQDQTGVLAVFPLYYQRIDRGRSLGTVRTLCRQWVLDTRLAYGLPLCPGSDGRPRCFSAVLSADRSRLASSSTICAAPARNGLIAPALPGAFLYSITSSARIRIDGGTVRPSALAVLVVTQLSAASTHEPSRGGA